LTTVNKVAYCCSASYYIYTIDLLFMLSIKLFYNNLLNIVLLVVAKTYLLFLDWISRDTSDNNNRFLRYFVDSIIIWDRVLDCIPNCISNYISSCIFNRALLLFYIIICDVSWILLFLSLEDIRKSLRVSFLITKRAIYALLDTSKI